MRGTIRTRLLVNALVDPAEAAERLPAGLRPHVVDGGTVVGCCLLELTAVRPAGVPSRLGLPLRAAAHRISVEWDGGSDEPSVGVYVPLRLTDSRSATAAGGRLFPGVHRRVPVRVEQDLDHGTVIAWTVEAEPGPDAWPVEVRAVLPGGPARGDAAPDGEPVAGTCLSAEIGLSPRRDGGLEAVRMTPAHRRATPVYVSALTSPFLDGFASSRPAPSYLMRDVEVVWSPAPGPRSARPTPQAA